MRGTGGKKNFPEIHFGAMKQKQQFANGINLMTVRDSLGRVLFYFKVNLAEVVLI